MKVIDFPVAVHKDVQVLDELIYRWARSKVAVETSLNERSKVEKLNWFVCYLFPQMEKRKLKHVAKLFFCMFMVDDYLDLNTDKQTGELLELMKSDSLITNASILSFYRFPIGKCFHQVLEIFESPQMKNIFSQTWDRYVEGLLWERKNQKENLVPTLQEYREMRLHSSGVMLAMHLLKAETGEICHGSKEFESAVARMIYLSNDLVSSFKEKAIGDIHNELLLLSGVHGNKAAIEMVQQELFQLKKKILTQGKMLGLKSTMCKAWVDNVFLFLGGCNYWSGETQRYRIHFTRT